MASLDAILHKFLFGAFGTDNIFLVCDEAATNQTSTAACAEEAVVVPVAVFKGDEFSSTNSSNRPIASEAAFGKKFAKAIGTVWLFVAAGKAFSS